MKLALLAVAVAAITLVSVEEEIAIGRSAQQQVRKEMRELRDPRVTGYISDIGRRLVRAASGPKYPYTFAVANYREINAFALPGGPVWINRGVIQAATDESQLAGVLAHEIAHVAQRHTADQLTKSMLANWGLGLLGAVLGNSGGAGAAQVAAGLLTDGVFLKFSRDAEREADRVGLQILTRAGWDARGMTGLFEILRRTANREPAMVERFFATHPSPQERIDGLRGDVLRSRGGIRDSAAFHTIKAQTMKLPAPLDRYRAQSTRN